MLIPIEFFPRDIIKYYDLMRKVKHGRVLVKITKVMYGIPQERRLSYGDRRIQASTTDTRTLPPRNTPNFFLLVIDDFGIKYTKKEYLNHLIKHLKTKYETNLGDGTKFCGINLKWDYKNRKVEMRMPKYIPNALKFLQHKIPSKAQNSPH